MPDHKFHGHEAIYFANEQKEDQPYTVSSPFIFGTDEGIMKVKLDEKKQQGKTDSAYHSGQHIKTEQIARLPAGDQLEKTQYHKVLHKKYGNGCNKNIYRHSYIFIVNRAKSRPLTPLQ
jgi:hypothetical protein